MGGNGGIPAYGISNGAARFNSMSFLACWNERCSVHDGRMPSRAARIWHKKAVRAAEGSFA